MRLLRDPRNGVSRSLMYAGPAAVQVFSDYLSSVGRECTQPAHSSLVPSCLPWATESCRSLGVQSKENSSKERMAYLPHFVQVGDPGGVCSNGVNEGAVGRHCVGTVSEDLSIEAAVEQPLAPLRCCLPRPYICIEQRHLQCKADVRRSAGCLC